MTSDTFSWNGGRIKLWDLEPISDDEPLRMQCDELKEDLAQIHYASGKLIDVGWYPELSENGEFVVVVVSGDTPESWEAPLFEQRVQTTVALRTALNQAIALASR
jgi:hypothetical protein